jgi:hypothetical protein
MMRRPIMILLVLAGCSKSQDPDLQYIKQARSLAAEWALVNDRAYSGGLTSTYVHSMRRWLHQDLRTALISVEQPDSRYGQEMRSLLAEPQDAAPAALRAHATTLKHIEESLESA